MNYVDSAHRAIYLRDIIKRIELEERFDSAEKDADDLIAAYKAVTGFADREVDHAA